MTLSLVKPRTPVRKYTFEYRLGGTKVIIKRKSSKTAKVFG